VVLTLGVLYSLVISWWCSVCCYFAVCSMVWCVQLCVVLVVLFDGLHACAVSCCFLLVSRYVFVFAYAHFAMPPLPETV
jgi:hypothetical protein